VAKPWVIVTGATGFLGSQLVRQLRKEYRVYALGRRAPRDVGLEEGPNVVSFRVDLGDSEGLREVFYAIRGRGAVELVIHMAGYYDFTGEDDPEYERTNVVGTRNLFELSVPLGLRRMIFVSSVAACPFPRRGGTVNEATAPSAPIPYARSKSAGEDMVRAYADRFPGCIVRPSAIFSDWCEYEPLYHFLDTWCSDRWNARVLGGRGESAVPYLHVDDLLSFCVRVVERNDEIEPSEVLLASPDGSTSHRELFREATSRFFGTPRAPRLVPRPLAALGLRVREAWGRWRGRVPFERAWMADYIDLALDVDAARTRRRLDWAPNPDRHVLRRMTEMVQNLKDHPDEWRLRRLRKQVRRTALPTRAAPHGPR
jgi:nucleoside-diphosphate-sugar epimerase